MCLTSGPARQSGIHAPRNFLRLWYALPRVATFPRPHRDHTSTAFRGRYGRGDSHG